MKTRASIIIAAILLLVACAPKTSPTPAGTLPPISSSSGSGSEMSVPATQSSSGTIEIAIQNFAYSPATITITTGSTVEWTNKDSASHTVTAVDGSWGSDNLAQDDTYSHTFDQAGTYEYKCSFHASMKGTIVVVNP
jgi:plastocyanin